MIKTLSPQLVRLIAAGEVVQHPTSAAKELIENALDAGASRVEIEAVDAGYSTLVVADNGTGMSRKDLDLAWQPHTTSKLSDEVGLTTISTFGFRGEALSSLSHVSRLEIRSRTKKQKLAFSTVSEQGKLVSASSPKAGSIGTTVTVSGLFSMVPARRKPRSRSTETKELLKLVSAYSLIFPKIVFTLRIDGKAWSWPASQTRVDRGVAFWSGSQASDFWSLELPLSNGKVVGLLSEPHLARRTSQGVCSINGRWVEWKQLEKLVRNVYGTTLEPGMHPAWCLHFELPFEQIDPNIHPAKNEVRVFDDDTLLASLAPQLSRILEENLLLPQRNELWKLAETSPLQHAAGVLRSETELPSLENADSIAQLHRLYLVTENKDGMILIDQHAAHERVLYEQFLKTWQQEQSPKSFELTPAVSFQVSPQDEVVLQEHQASLESTGWEIESFGPGHWIVRAVPELLHDREPSSLLRGALDDLEAGLLDSTLHPHHHRLLATLACKSAIKAGYELTPKARKELVKQLSETTTNFSCPHGRPVMAFIPWSKVEEWFHR